jgi:hypothetical protein
VQWGGSTNIAQHATHLPAANGSPAQIWSDAVTVSNCNKPTFDSPNAAPFQTEFRNSDGNANFHGHYFSWCFVMRYAMACAGFGRF